MKYFLISVRIMFFLMLVLGVAYPLSVTLVAQVVFPEKANGSLLYEQEQLRGSWLIGQNFERPAYFWPRPSATSYSTLPSGGSNLAPTAKALQDSVQQRREKLQAAHPGGGAPPQDLWLASGSGLDPHESVAAVQYQMARVAKARGMTPQEVQNLVALHIEKRQWGFLGEEVVNVLALNKALDKLKPLTR